MFEINRKLSSFIINDIIYIILYTSYRDAILANLASDNSAFRFLLTAMAARLRVWMPAVSMSIPTMWHFFDLSETLGGGDYPAKFINNPEYFLWIFFCFSSVGLLLLSLLTAFLCSDWLKENQYQDLWLAGRATHKLLKATAKHVSRR